MSTYEDHGNGNLLTGICLFVYLIVSPVVGAVRNPKLWIALGYGVGMAAILFSVVVWIFLVGVHRLKLEDSDV